MLLSRSLLLAGLVSCLGGAWLLEQPGSSRLPLYPRFEELVWAPGMRVWRTAWWQRLYGSLTPCLGLVCWVFGVSKEAPQGVGQHFAHWFAGPWQAVEAAA